MRKLVATGAVVAMVFAATSPAFAQAQIGDDVLFVDASQVQLAAAVQVGDANAAADDYSSADASNSLTIDQYQFNGGLGGYYWYY